MTGVLDPADLSTDNHDAKPHEKSKRGRFKEALDRTRHKIAERVKEEKEARKWSSNSGKDQPDGALDADVADFLAAGRANTSSSTHLSVFSDTASENGSLQDRSSPPRPSTSDSKVQASPKRIHVPRIDVSASQRFPNAKEIGNSPAELPASLTTRGGSLLKPEYKSRSQSTSSIATASRKARVRERGLSVGFIDAPPVIIGEGGDEAEAPPVEISRAKSRRAKSASPHGRMLQHDTTEDGRQMPRSGHMNQAADRFVPKPMFRVHTGASPNMNMVPNTSEDNFAPMSFKRTGTGMLDARISPIPQHAPPLPQMRKPIVPADLGKSQIVTNEQTRELELSLGLTPISPAPRENQGLPIFAPKPQRAPPSYDLIEAGKGQDQPKQQSEPAISSTTPLNGLSQRQNTQQQSVKSIPQHVHRADNHDLLPQQIALANSQIRPQIPQQSVHTGNQKQSLQHGMHQDRQQQIPPHAARPQDDDGTPQQLAGQDHHQQIPQPVVRPEIRIQQQEHHQQMPPISELPARQESLTSRPLPGAAKQQQEIFPSVPIHQQHKQENILHGSMGQNSEPSQAQQYRLPEQDFGQSLELSAEQISQPNAQEQREQLFPEYEDYMRSSTLQEQGSPPKTNLSRFASLHASAVRNTSSDPRQHSLPENEPSKFVEQPPALTSRALPPIETSHDRAVRPSLSESSQSSSQPASSVASSATGLSRHPVLRRVAPLETIYHSSPSDYSPSVTSPQSGVEPGPTKMRFYESINQGNPPAGYI